MNLTLWIRRNNAVNKLRDAIAATLNRDSDALRRASLSAFIRQLDDAPDLDPDRWLREFESEFHLPARAKAQLARDLVNGQELLAARRVELFQEVGAISRTVDPAALEAAYSVDFPRLERDARRTIGEQIRRLVAEGGDAAKIAQKLREGRVVAYQAKTLSNTALAQFNNSYTKAIAQEAGIDRYRYIGPSAVRPFCMRLLASNRDYTEAEINLMDNGQGLSVMSSCGGYNCQHQWIAVPEEVTN